MANLRLEQHAGTRVGQVDVPSDFLAFADICRRMSIKQHCNPDGLYQIVQLAAGMNPSGKRGYSTDLIIRSLTKMKA